MKAMFIAVFILTSFIQNDGYQALKMKAVKELDDEFSFIKPLKLGRNIYTDHKYDFEQTCVFSKDTHYQITLAEEGEPKDYQLKATLYDVDRKVIMTTEVNGVLKRKMTYYCQATSIYYLKYEWKTIPFKGVAGMGFRR